MGWDITLCCLPGSDEDLQGMLPRRDTQHNRRHVAGSQQYAPAYRSVPRVEVISLVATIVTVMVPVSHLLNRVTGKPPRRIFNQCSRSYFHHGPDPKKQRQSSTTAISSINIIFRYLSHLKHSSHRRVSDPLPTTITIVKHQRNHKKVQQPSPDSLGPSLSPIPQIILPPHRKRFL